MKIIKLIARWIGALGLVLFTLILGLVVGMTYGGNYDVSFYFAGVVGYEAWGVLGAQLFGVVGLAAGAMLVVPKAWRLPKKVICLVALFSVFVTLTWQLFGDSYATLPWFILILPALCTAALLYLYYFVAAPTQHRLYVALLGGAILLGAFLLFTLKLNYACLRWTAVCFVEAPAVTAAVKENPTSANTPVKFVSQVTLYGDIYTLEKYCSDFALVWNFGDGETIRKTGCDSYPPVMQPSTRGWVKHTYAQAGDYQVSLEFIYRGQSLGHTTTTAVVQ